jgi:hypothetical protein
VEDILAPALEAAGIEIKKIDLTRKKSVFLENVPQAMTFEDFGHHLRESISEDVENHLGVFKATKKHSEFVKMVTNHARGRRILYGDKAKPEEFASYQLNLDLASHPPKFFVTTKDEYLSDITGSAYVSLMGMKHEEAFSSARPVFMEYDPRGARGVRAIKSGRETKQIFNTYVPPLWKGHPALKTKNPRIHPLFQKCLKHVFPLKKERLFFYGWLYASLFKRAPTYLILCGNAGLGKNRIKLLLRALHGHENTPDGKKSSLTERFNSQVERTTLLWFDELVFNEAVENILKEMQNETISIERKGVDATRSTKIYSSMVISNNYPRNNYIQFDSRKFVPLELGTTRLGTSMTHKEIDTLTKMTSFPDSPEFDVEALAEFVAWLKKNGPRFMEMFPNLEYKGPMFYRLAHTTMSRWQIVAISFLFSDKLKGAFVSDKPELGAKWSVLEPPIRKSLYKGYNWPHPETIKRFLEIYCSLDGKPGFEITPIHGVESDFYVKPLLKKMPSLETLAASTGIDEDESDIDLL